MERNHAVSAPPPFQRETYEFQPINVTVNGSAVTTGVEVAIVELGARPSTWGTVTTIGTAIGVMVSGTALGGVGTFEVYAKVTDSPEVPVLNCGTFRIV
jgi:hypothetical protein